MKKRDENKKKYEISSPLIILKEVKTGYGSQYFEQLVWDIEYAKEIRDTLNEAIEDFKEKYK